MAYNKTKFVEAAQKHLAQGRIAQAIAEYQQILRHEPKDQVTLMTIGDLYVRQGETFQALEYFERLAQLFLSDGFTAKAIAIYKKVAKLAPEESRPLERLAELYVQQGVMSEARPLYLQLAEAHLKANRHPQAVVLLRKLLEVEPENLRVQMRLAELYQAIGQGKEAAETYHHSARRLLERGDHAEAEKLADRALKIDPGHAGVLALKARAMAALGKRSEAAALLEGLPELEAGGEPTVLLIEQYLHIGQIERAATLSAAVFERNPKNFELAYKVSAALLDAGEADRAHDLLGRIREAMIEAGDHDRLAQALTAAVGRMPGRLEPLEWLADLYARNSDSFHLPDALAQLGDAAAVAGQFERAQEVFEQLLERDPENEAARQRLNQIRAKRGLQPAERPAEVRVAEPLKPAVAPAARPAPGTPAAEPELDDETQRFIAQSLIDVDLFSSYGLTQKAVDLLETLLQRAPRHAATLEKLLDFHLGAGNDRRTAELAGQLEQIHLERGDATNAGRFSELRRRFQRAAGLADEGVAEASQPSAPPEFAVPMVEAVPVSPAESQPAVEVEAVPPGESVVHEVDLSEEWATLSARPVPAAPAPPQTPAPAEAAPQVVAPPEPAAPLAATAAELTAATPVEPALIEAAEQVAEPVAELPAEYELELVPAPVEAEAVEAKAQPAAGDISADQFLADLATEFGALAARQSGFRATSSVSTGGPPPLGATHGAVADQPPAGVTADAEPLREVFEEFRAELGEIGAEEEDLETHYNLGIAFREMGLLEEAIGEFQRVAKENDKGRAFRYAMQCCTLLGLAFMEKGQPGIAAMWYERALQTPGLDQESILALRYDLGVAQELAGDEAAALKSFSQVYGMNIDYRDVAERIAALEKRR